MPQVTAILAATRALGFSRWKKPLKSGVGGLVSACSWTREDAKFVVLGVSPHQTAWAAGRVVDTKAKFGLGPFDAGRCE